MVKNDMETKKGAGVSTKDMVRIAIDIGGTFTDLCITFDDGSVWTSKVLTTPEDPSRGFAEVLDLGLSKTGKRPVMQIAHGTTMATNAILEGKTARLGMITTRGFRDVLEIGRHFRRDLYNLFLRKPPPLVPRERRLEVTERVSASGQVIRPLDESEVAAAVDELVRQRVEALVICFLHSYKNTSHEIRAREIVQQRSGLPVVLSHAVCSEFREYERFSSAVISAGIMPVVSRYLDRIDEERIRRSIHTPLSVMQSNGGMLPTDVIRRAPASIVESGPAAGVIAAVEVGRRLGIGDLICFDMGGTTAKATLVKDGQIALNNDYEVGGGIQGGFGTGYPLRVPVVDLVEIGTGGGSIAIVDEAGQLHVGPRSAGADPGPACYGRGGTEPTVTDANLVLGRLRPDNFAGKKFELHPEKSVEAIHTQIAIPLGISVTEAAEGIVRIANAQMGEALKVVSVQRGHDPAEYSLIAFGGAGPMHAVELARELGCPRVVIPPEAGVQSAWGMLVADARYDFAQSLVSESTKIDPRHVEKMFRNMAEEGHRTLLASGFSSDRLKENLSVDVRYLGQAYELTVEIGEVNAFSRELIEKINQAFHRSHERLYGHSQPDSPVEWVTVRAAVIGDVGRPQTRWLTSSEVPLAQRGLKHQSMVWSGAKHEAHVFQREALALGDRVEGPALILQDESTVNIPPGAELMVEASGDLVIHVDTSAVVVKVQEGS